MTEITTNKAIALKKARKEGMTPKAKKAIMESDPQAAIDSLTGKQKAFVEEYLVDLNGTQAVIRAGYQTKYPGKIAFQLLEKPVIRLAIDSLKAQRTKNADVTKDFVLRGIQKAIRLAEESGNLNALLRGHELLARHLGMFVERTEISGPDGHAIELEQREIQQGVDKFTSKLVALANRSKND